jgi:hypothetical protein
MKTRLLIIIGTFVVITSIVLTLFVIIPSIQKMDPNYVKNKIAELEEMPCYLMSENHVHEIEDEEHYQAYDKKYAECFGYIP